MHRWSGGLAPPYGNAVGLPVRVGVPFTAGMGELEAARRIRIESVQLHDPGAGVVLEGALVPRSGVGIVSADPRFPPTFPRVRMRPADGVVLPAHTRLDLVVGVR